MSWFRIDDEWADSPKVDAVSDVAARLWAMCGTWVSKRKHRHLDGFVPRAALATITKRRWSDDVLEAAIVDLVETSKVDGLYEFGLWETREGGWRFHDWEKYKPKDSDDEPLSTTEAASVGGQASAAARREKYGSAQPKKPSKMQTIPERSPNVGKPFDVRSGRTSPERLEPPDPDPDPSQRDPAKAVADVQDLTGSTRSRVPREAEDPVNVRRKRVRTEWSELSIRDLAIRCREDPCTAAMAGPENRPEVLQVQRAWCEAVGLPIRSLGSLSAKNGALQAILAALEAHSLDEVLRACDQAKRDDWARGIQRNRDGTDGKKCRLEWMSLNVIRRLLDEADAARPSSGSAAVAKMLAQVERERSGAAP